MQAQPYCQPGDKIGERYLVHPINETYTGLVCPSMI
jgi:hypothetical protein